MELQSRKKEIVQALPYKMGDEDGWAVVEGDGKIISTSRRREEVSRFRSLKGEPLEPKPFLVTKQGLEFISEKDYIIETKGGRRVISSSCIKEEFIEKYPPVTKLEAASSISSILVTVACIAILVLTGSLPYLALLIAPPLFMAAPSIIKLL